MNISAVYNNTTHLKSWVYSNYSKSTTLRYSSYALAVFGAIAAFNRDDRLKIKLSFMALSSLFIGWNIKECREKRPPSLEKNLLIVSRLSSMIFTLAFFWGIAIIGAQLRLTVIEGKSLFQGLRQRNPFAVLKALNQFCSIVSLGLPIGGFLVRKADEYFHSDLADKIRASFLQYLENNPAQKKKPLRDTFSKWPTFKIDPKIVEFTF